MRSFLILFFTLTHVVLFGQHIIIQGVVTDKAHNEQKKAAHIYINSIPLEYLTYSNNIGLYSLYYEYEKPVELICTFIGYNPIKIELDDKLVSKAKNGILNINFSLIESENQLPVINITSVQKPDTIYGSVEHSVSDYAFYKEGMVLLVYDKRLKKEGKLLLTDSSMNIVDTYIVPSVAQELETDYAGNITLLCNNSAYKIMIENNKLQLLPINKDDYLNYVKPIVDTLNNQIFFSTWTDRYPSFSYYDYEVLDSTYKLIHEIADKFTLELCRADYKYLPGHLKLYYYRLELATGVDKEKLACIDGFKGNMYYDALYAPMFIINDTILIFDHYANQLYKYNMHRELLDSLPISYHNPQQEVGNDFSQLLVKDSETNVIYAVFQHQGGRCYLKQINIETGAVSAEFNLAFPFVSEIQIKNGMVYYIYRPFESIQKKYLYREKIN